MIAKTKNQDQKTHAHTRTHTLKKRIRTKTHNKIRPATGRVVEQR